MDSLYHWNVTDEPELLTPCSSCSTLVTEIPNPDDHSVHSPTAQITIILPNLVDRITINVVDIENFILLYVGTEITVTHLLIYLVSLHIDPGVTCINNLKLLHMGKQYSVLRWADLKLPQPSLAAVILRFSTFQLFISQNLTCPPLMASLDFLVTHSVAGLQVEEDWGSVTYADAMIKIIKKVLRRKLSVSSIEMSRTSRTSLHDSTTDVDETSRPMLKVRNSWKRAFRRKPETC